MMLFTFQYDPLFPSVCLRAISQLQGYEFDTYIAFEGCFACNLYNLFIIGAQSYEFEVFSVRTIQTFQGA